MSRTYYKVCDNSCGGLYSYARYNIIEINQDLPVRYVVGKWVYPNVRNTKLMVFETLEALKSFLEEDNSGEDFEDCSIYECEIINPTTKGIFINVKSAWYHCKSLSQELNNCIQLKDKRKKYSHLCVKPPKGTVFCSAVKLIKEIKL